MKRILNTLYITTQESYLSKEGEGILLEKPSGEKFRFPFLVLESIICFGNVRVSPFLLGACAANGVQFSFCSEYGKFLWRIQGTVHGNVLLRKAQYRISDDETQSSDIARFFLMGKLNNSRTVVERYQREHSASRSLKEASQNFHIALEKIKEPKALDSLRGIEGEATHQYFSVFNELVLAQKEDFKFSGRNRRPPADKINALLSFAYTLLYHDACSCLEGVGLDPAVGFLHRDRPGRMSLALDFIEEFRPFFADRLILTLINRKEIRAEHFDTSIENGVLLTEEGRKIFLNAYQERKKEEITHPFLKEKMRIGIMFHTQAQLLARYIRGEMNAYPVFLWR